MKLCIQQKVFSFRDRFYVTDEFGEERYYVEGEIFSLGKKLHVYDMQGREVAFIQQELLTFMPRFMVYVGEEQAAEIVKEFTFFRPSYRVDGPGWQVSGDFFAHEYEISDPVGPVVSISKEWFTWGDCYQLDISPSADQALALAVVLAIDCVLDQDNGGGISFSFGGD